MDELTKKVIADRLSGLSGDEAVLRLLALCLGRVYLNMHRRGNHDYLAPDREKHIADWLAAAVLSRERWLSVTDERGRAKKLMKFGTAAAIVAEADKAMIKFAQRSRAVRLAEGDEALELELADGWYAVKLLTPAALDRESGQMQHCIGQGGYDRALAKGTSTFLSLRDPVGKAHATLEIVRDGNRLAQLQGKQNRTPEQRYIRLLAPLFRKRELRFSQIGHSDRLLFDADYNVHDVTRLPDGLTFDGDVTLSNVNGIDFPENLRVNGNLYLSGCHDMRLPSCLEVGEHLTIRNARRVRKGGTIKVAGTVYLDGSEVPELADRLVADCLRVTGCDPMRLPGKLELARDLAIRKTDVRDIAITALLGALDIEYSDVGELPEGLSVGSLRLKETDIRKLPENLTVLNNVTLIAGSITTLPAGMTDIDGTLDISGSRIERLPAGMRIRGSLVATNSSLTELPAGLEVERNLRVAGTRITALPAGLAVNETLDISGTGIEALPDGLRVGGSLRADNTERLATIGRDVRIGGRASFDRSAVPAIPSDFRCGGSLSLAFTAHLASLPEGMAIDGSLSVTGSALETMPDEIDVGGDLFMQTTAISDLGPGVSILGNLHTEGSGMEGHCGRAFVRGDIHGSREDGHGQVAAVAGRR